MTDEREQLRRMILARAVEHKEVGFVLASGKKSNLYIDLRKITQDPVGINLIGNLVLQKISELAPQAEYVGGLETGSIPIATAVCLLSGMGKTKLKGAFWVRKSAKDHGLQNLVEGNLSRGSDVVILDDTVTTGGSSMQAIEAVNELGCKVLQTIAIVDRGAAVNFENAKIPYFYFFSEKDLVG